MAKLSAHGTEVARYSRTLHFSVEKDPRRESTTTVYALMSDGVILRKDSVVLRGEESFKGSNKLKWNWKVVDRRRGHDYGALGERLLWRGYEKVSP
jgi:hypothetical protein